MSMRRSGSHLSVRYVLEDLPRGRYAVRGRPRRAVGSVRARMRGRAVTAAGCAPRVSARLVARPLSPNPARRSQDGRRLLAAPQQRLRAAQRARVRTGRIAPPGALAVDGAPLPADGEGARGLASRRDRGPPRRAMRRQWSGTASRCRCERQARSWTRTSAAGGARARASTPQRREVQHVHSPGGGLAARARAARCGRADGRTRRSRGSCSRRTVRGTGARARRGHRSSRAGTRSTGSFSERSPGGGSRSSSSTRRASTVLPAVRSLGCCACRPRESPSPSYVPAINSPRASPASRHRMPHMLKTVALSAAAALVIAVDWLRFEEPRSGGGRPFVLAALAIGAGAAAAALAAACGRRACGADRRQRRVLALSARTLARRRRLLRTDRLRFSRGFLDFYDFRLPIDPTTHPAMHAVILDRDLRVHARGRARGRIARTRSWLSCSSSSAAGWPAHASCRWQRARSRYRHPCGRAPHCSPA